MPLTPEEQKELTELKAMVEGGAFDDVEENEVAQTGADFARGAASGLSAGFTDEITGVLGAAIDPQNLGGKVEEAQMAAAATRNEASKQDPRDVISAMRAEGFSDEEIAAQLEDLKRFKETEGPTTYGVYRDRARRLQDEAAERSPIATTAGEVGGAVASGVMSGATQLPALAAEGALFGLGNAEGDVADQAVSTGLGAATGLAGGAAGKYLDEGIDSIKGFLRSKASKKAIDALEATTSQKEKLYDADRIGRELLDEKIVGAGRSTSKMRDKTQAKLSEFGDKLDDAYDNFGGAPIAKDDVVNRLLDKATELDSETANKPIVKKILEFADDIETNRSIKTYSPKSIRKEKQALDRVTNFNSDAPTQQANQAIRSAFRETEEDAFSKIGMPEEFISLKRKVGDLETIDKILGKSEKRSPGLIGQLKTATNIGVGGAGVYEQNPYLMGLAALGAGSRKIGSGGGARLLDKMSNVTNRLPRTGTASRVLMSQDPYSE